MNFLKWIAIALLIFDAKEKQERIEKLEKELSAVKESMKFDSIAYFSSQKKHNTKANLGIKR
jgi:hypothetical protein